MRSKNFTLYFLEFTLSTYYLGGLLGKLCFGKKYLGKGPAGDKNEVKLCKVCGYFGETFGG